MNIKRLILGTCFTVAVAITLVSCEGPAGAPGPQGLIGVTGTAAALPLPGSYNVLDSSWILSTTVANQYTCQINDTNIVKTNTTDVILVYAQGTTTTDYFPLPVTNILATNDMLSYSYNDTAITLYYTNTASTVVPPTTTLNVQAVAILPATIKAHPNTNFNNFHDVMVLVNELKAEKRQ